MSHRKKKGKREGDHKTEVWNLKGKKGKQEEYLKKTDKIEKG